MPEKAPERKDDTGTPVDGAPDKPVSAAEARQQKAEQIAATVPGGVDRAAATSARAAGQSMTERGEALDRADPDFADRHAHDDLVPDKDPPKSKDELILERHRAMLRDAESGLPVADPVLMEEVVLADETATIQLVKVQDAEAEEIVAYFESIGIEGVEPAEGIPLMPLLRRMGGAPSGKHRPKRAKKA